ncbi:hypothetical protein [Simplicispira psychrophila]|uniref:hypothetical protein n=1 Tax=Simplicispira psychrophila TaxID=80882 RepID=UPI000487569F|nr:hypothetical protein [Simplicispira psychrophila]
MHRLVSVLFIVLLLLRSLMGSAMASGPLPSLPTPAMQHTAQPAPAPLLVGATGSAAHDHGARPPLPDNADNAGPDTGSPGCAGHADHTGQPDCTTCAGCHAAMLAPPALYAYSAHPTSEKTARTATRFASAPAALAIKPPIA